MPTGNTGSIRATGGGGSGGMSWTTYMNTVHNMARPASNVTADMDVFVDDGAVFTQRPRIEIPVDEMKKRHLNGTERSLLHKPKKDWIISKEGKEVCRSAVVLVVDDLIEMCK